MEASSRPPALREASSPALVSTPPRLTSVTRSWRVCGGNGCGRQISGEALDPHNSCVKCRGHLCRPDRRCDECKEWEESVVLTAYQHQLSLEAERKSHSKFHMKGHVQSVPSVQSLSSTSGLGVCAAPQAAVEEGELSDCSLHPSHSGVDPGPSASQVDSAPAGDMQGQMSNVLRVMSQFATFLGMSGASSPTTLKEVVRGVVKEAVVDEVANYLSVSAPPLSAAVTSGAPPSTDRKQLICYEAGRFGR